jgi:hypothetical protein
MRKERKKMTTKKILELVEDFYKMEYKDIQLVVERNIMANNTKANKFHVNSSLQRCLGVALFVQSMDVPFEDVNKLYEEYRGKISRKG